MMTADRPKWIDRSPACRLAIALIDAGYEITPMDLWVEGKEAIALKTCNEQLRKLWEHGMCDREREAGSAYRYKRKSC